MFDIPTREATLIELRRRLAETAPVVAVEPSVLPVPDALAGLLPGGGLPKGGIISLVVDDDDQAGAGTTSLLFSLLAGPTKPWSALVGLPDLGMQAAAELGVDLARVVLIPNPGVDLLQVLSVLADGVDLIAVASYHGPLASPARLRVLSARLKQRGTVLVAMGDWAGADLTLSVSVAAWGGLGTGHGRLRDRELVVRLRGRRAQGQFREVRILLRSEGVEGNGRVHITSAGLVPAVAQLRGAPYIASRTG
ncbi:hypothetical protein EH165_06250 [Nakamurella antarctica]|uniref:RecA DNA recombination protein n=1 Tax=Nakamurella antarctica TaxID=1902245 RepID=A0A3G8ZKV8_9ACTN|nr:hypothetical protein [Nakamurella antarctica]AZI57808.1 hypothetical protein EH165_06250 [Nakamurella antarctica]